MAKQSLFKSIPSTQPTDPSNHPWPFHFITSGRVNDVLHIHSCSWGWQPLSARTDCSSQGFLSGVFSLKRYPRLLWSDVTEPRLGFSKSCHVRCRWVRGGYEKGWQTSVSPWALIPRRRSLSLDADDCSLSQSCSCCCCWLFLWK